MRLYKCALLCALLAISLIEPIAAKRTFGGGHHSYPKSGGHSGSGGGHHYPSSGGLSGGGHGYPSSGGSHANPSSGSHGYPSGGLSGSNSGGSHNYPSSGNNHAYPSSGGLSGSGSSNTHHTNNHGYPAGKGLAGNTGSTTNIHHHYHYSPPQQISYAPVRGGAPVHYPVYQGSPPNYVYQYKDSGSKYGTLLAGLALLNLGTLAGTAYIASQQHKNYKPQPGEVCKFGIKKDNGDYEETKIDCQLITSFIFQEQAKAQNGPNNTAISTTTVTNVTIVNTTNSAPDAAQALGAVNQTVVANNPLYEMLPNGTLVPINATATNVTSNATEIPAPATDNPMPSSVVMTSITSNTTTTVMNALDVKGQAVQVTPGMQCYVLRHTTSSNMKRSVPCGLLQTYADKSLQKNSAGRNSPAFILLVAVVAAFAY